MTAPISSQSLTEAIDRCVKCGLCLPECPTYGLRSDENESPRGRLALIEGWLSGRLQADDALRAHLDQCLGCRRCERVCPSAVPYGAILDATRAKMATKGRARSRLTQVLNSPALLRQGTRLARQLPLGMSQPWPSLQRMHRMARALPTDTMPPAPGVHPTTARSSRGRIGLFTGCVTAIHQAAALRDATQMLQIAGFDVLVPDRAVCCGALARHDGNVELADSLTRAHREVFTGQVDGVVSIASGCGVVLDEAHAGSDAPHYDICRFLVEQGALTDKDFLPMTAAALVHVPCTIENVYRGRDWATQLLGLIPALQQLPVNEPGTCCGSAGDYLLRYPETAAALRAPVIEKITELSARKDAAYLVSSNIGCAIHLAVGLQDNGISLPVLHPVQLLAMQAKSLASGEAA